MSLQSDCTPASLAAAFAAHGEFPFPASDFPATDAAKRRLAVVEATARAALDAPWPVLTASGYTRFFRDGIRDAYECPYFLRRRRLALFALAWAATCEEVFATAAADGIWLVCEESTWCLPAHFSNNVSADVVSHLPGPGSTGYIDLFNCETASVIAEACQLLGPSIDERVATRAREEIRRRVIDPLLAGVNPWWTEGTNNWSVWCASNLIIAASFVLSGESALWGRFVHRMFGVVDRYVARQGADGGCDEGVTYWTVAGACVLTAIEEARARTGGLPTIWIKPKLREILLFPARMHMGGGCFPAFSDGIKQVRLPGGVLARAAELVVAPEMLAIAQQFSNPAAEVDLASYGVSNLIAAQLRALYWLDTKPETSQSALADAWLPDLQVMVAHGAGTALAVKGGHNAENHNHCDIGQFVVHRNGQPLLVDAGRGDYTRQTFSAERYELWWTRGAGHAVPQIDGHEQIPGAERAARAVKCLRDEERVSLELDLAGCYAADAGLNSLLRRVTLSRRDGAVTLTDRVDAGREVEYVLPLLTTAEPRSAGNGTWIVAVGGEQLRIDIDADKLSGTVEPVAIDDTLTRNWGTLWRITLRGRLAVGEEVLVSITPA